MRLFRHPLFVAVAALALLLPGCEFTDVWLPDSSGFLFLDPVDDPNGDRKAVWHYDLKLKKSRKIDAGGIISSNLDVSIDGKKIACLVRVNDKDGQLVVLDLAGKELHRSKTFRFPKRKSVVKNKEGKNEEMDAEPVFNASLEWFPQGDRILIGDGLFHATYTFEENQLPRFDEGDALLSQRRGGVCPRIIRPDGLGYYFTTTDGKETKLFFQPTQGKRTQLKRFANDANFAKLTNELGQLPPFSWKKDKLVGTFFGSQVVEIDVDKANVALHLDNLEKVTKERQNKPKVRQKIVFAGKEFALLVKEDADQEWLEIENIKDQTTIRLEFTTVTGGLPLMPSPDLKHVAVLCRKVGVEGQRYVILDAQGRVYDEVPLPVAKGPK